MVQDARIDPAAVVGPTSAREEEAPRQRSSTDVNARGAGAQRRACPALKDHPSQPIPDVGDAPEDRAPVS